jgi:hypothetical protein
MFSKKIINFGKNLDKRLKDLIKNSFTVNTLSINQCASYSRA